MRNHLIALAIASAMSVSATAQPAPTTQNGPATNQAQAAKPQMVKKIVCEDNDNPYSHINRVCHTIEVPAKPATSADSQRTAPQDNSGN